MRGRRFLWFLVMIALGLVAGLIFGWIVSPARSVSTTPETLRSDYKADYVLMVAEIYHADQDLEQAARRLGLLGSLSPTQLVAQGILKARELNYSPADIDLMYRLAAALQGPPLAPTGTVPAGAGQP